LAGLCVLLQNAPGSQLRPANLALGARSSRRFRANTHLRVGIGAGPGAGADRDPPVNRLNGPAFIFARAALESVKRRAGHKFNVLTEFRSRNAVFDSTANLIYGLHDTLLLRIKDKQWETIKTFRIRRRLNAAAHTLHVDNSTVSRNLQRGYFWQLEQTVAGMQTLIRSEWP
jgi:hypothetical protein